MISSKEIVFYILISGLLGGVYLFRHNKWRIALLGLLVFAFAICFGSFNIIGLDTSFITNYVNKLRISTPELLMLQQIPAFAIYFLSLLLGALTCILITENKLPSYRVERSLEKGNTLNNFNNTTTKSRVVSFNRVGFVLRN